jgi:hypothetical protein
LDTAKLISKVCDKYANCNTYRARGELRTSVSCWGEVHFETFFLAPKNLLVRLIYGAPEKPIQTDMFWTNGTDFYTHASGTNNKCERIKNEIDFFAFGMGTFFEFEVPMLLLPDAQKLAGRLTHSEFEFCDNDAPKGSILLRCKKDFSEGEFENTFEVSIDKKEHSLNSVKSTESYGAMQKFGEAMVSKHPSLVAPMKTVLLGTPKDATPKLFLMLGKPGVFPIQPISTECIYHEVAFNEKIPPSLFKFSPPAD